MARSLPARLVKVIIVAAVSFRVGRISKRPGSEDFFAEDDRDRDRGKLPEASVGVVEEGFRMIDLSGGVLSELLSWFLALFRPLSLSASDSATAKFLRFSSRASFSRASCWRNLS